MEIKDWIYTGSIFLTFSVSVYSVYLNKLNRNNGVREHLYKEQFEIYKVLISLHIDIMGLFNQVRMFNVTAQIQEVAIRNQLAHIHKLVVQNAFFITNSLETHLRNAETEGERLVELMKSKASVTEDDIHALAVSYSNVIDYIRNEIGTDKLSDENKRIFGSVITKEE